MVQNSARKRVALRPYQLVVVIMCTLLNALDGYDIFIMGFAIPYLPDDFASDTANGYLLSASLVGMGIGSILFAPMADKYGRRMLLIAALTVNAFGMAASALAPSYSVLFASRLVTGISVGTIATVVVVLAPEAVSKSWRSFAVGIVMLGYPLGSTLAGLSGATLLAAVGGSWQGMFWVGLVLCLIALAVTIFFMPESTAFLVSRGDDESLRRAAVNQDRLGLEEEIDEARADAAPTHPRTVRLLGHELRTLTLLLWVTYGGLSAAFYFISSWTPKLITDATDNVSEGTLAGLMVSLGTLAGAGLYATVGHRFVPARYAATAIVVAVAALVGFAVTLSGPFALTMAFLMGTSVYGAMAATVTSTLVYPALARTRGMGSMIGVARVGAIVAPILAGYALAFVSIRSLYLAVVVLLAIALLAGVGLVRRARTSAGSTDREADLQTAN
ncbi:MFS transporter [Dietzia psychralcaliphila]|uniref:MFS transporter n=1 Tax=Dietzia psychralcaliphila TaxID=139021 RepID=UPI001C1E201C|nr:MFS transporter [Dietzia psychralcaliphila]